MKRHTLALVAAFAVCIGGPVAAQSARAAAPVDLTGYWVSVVTEDWPWRMHTPAKGDYASIPLNAEGRRVADLWTEAQDGSCLAFGAAALLRMPTRVHITWADDSTLKLETDNGGQTRLFRFDAAAASANAPRSLQGVSLAEWQQSEVVRARGAEGGESSARVDEGAWTLAQGRDDESDRRVAAAQRCAGRRKRCRVGVLRLLHRRRRNSGSS